MIAYDDNFGEWHDMEDPEVRNFYAQCQRTNVEKKCKGCEQLVRIQPHYAYCNACADAIERGTNF
jgi:hypothetical protein